MNKAGETRSCSAGDKLPKSTGEIDTTLLGDLLNCTGEVAPLGVCIPPGNNLILRLPGMLVKEYLHTLLGNIEIFWGYPTSLRLTVA